MNKDLNLKQRELRLSDCALALIVALAMEGIRDEDAALAYFREAWHVAQKKGGLLEHIDLFNSAGHLLEIAKQCAKDCTACHGTGKLDKPSNDSDCEACAAVHAVIRKAEGTST